MKMSGLTVALEFARPFTSSVRVIDGLPLSTPIGSKRMVTLWPIQPAGDRVLPAGDRNAYSVTDRNAARRNDRQEYGRRSNRIASGQGAGRCFDLETGPRFGRARLQFELSLSSALSRFFGHLRGCRAW